MCLADQFGFGYTWPKSAALRPKTAKTLARVTLQQLLIFSATLATALFFSSALRAADSCQYKSINGTVTLSGVDDATYVSTPIWAQLNFADGIASELYIENHDSSNPIYFSGLATGTNQYNAGTGRTGQQVGPGQNLRYPLSIYQSKNNPVTTIDVTWEYCADLSLSKSWSAKPKQAGRSTPELEAALLAAVKASDVAAVTKLLQSGASPDATDPQYGYSALMLAARKNNLEIVKLLLDLHSNPNRKAKDGYTALIFAANCGDLGVEVAHVLLKAGADPGARQKNGFSALGILSGGTAPKMEALLRRAGVPD